MGGDISEWSARHTMPVTTNETKDTIFTVLQPKRHLIPHQEIENKRKIADRKQRISEEPRRGENSDNRWLLLSLACPYIGGV
jgi:hypothetical protein